MGGVPGGCGDKDLRALFSNYGEVLDVYILASKASQEGQRGCAFVRYASPQSCAIAIEALHGKYAMKTGELPLVVRFADPPKNQRGSANAYGGNNAANGRFPWGAGAPPVWPAGPPPPGWPMPWAAMGMGPYAPWVMPPGMTAPQNGTTPYGFYGYGAQQPQVGQPPQQQFGATSPPPPPDNPTGAPPLPPQPAPAQSPAQAWTEHQTPEGLKYYYNNTTGTSSWECPPELRPAQQPSSSAALQSVNALAPAMAALNVSTSSAMGAFSAGGPATSGAMNGMGSYQNSSSLVGSGALGSLPSLSNGSLNGRGGGMDGLGMGGLPGLNTLGASQPPASSSVMSQELSNGFQQEVQLPHFLNEGASSSGRGGYESSLSGSQARHQAHPPPPSTHVACACVHALACALRRYRPAQNICTQALLLIPPS